MKRLPSTRAVANEALLVEIRASHLRSKRSYGSPRVWRELKRRRGRLDEKRVARLMARDGLRANEDFARGGVYCVDNLAIFF